MSRKSKNAVLFAVPLTVVVFATSTLFFISQASSNSLPLLQNAPSRSGNRGRRNLSLQREAFRAARQLGNRFGARSRSVSVFSGQLSIAGIRQPVTLTRRQTEPGETVGLSLGERTFTWTAGEGLKTTAGAPTAGERLLLERLILDSPDNFVLAQVRGASYFTVARNVRPADADDSYAGPLWNLVRVDEPQEDEKVRPLSTWRIYYINVQTGLPDSVEYQLNGKEIRAEFLEWTEAQGEKNPSRIRWSSDDQTIMEYRTTNVSHNQ